MALIEEFDKSGNWLFRWRSFLPIVLYVMALAVMLVGADEQMDYTNTNWMIICLVVTFVGLLVRAITIGYTPRGTSGRNTKEGQVAEVLNTKGIYSVCRHPLYLGNFFMWLGIIMYVGNWWFTLVCSLMFWLYYERIMFAEEYFLRKKFGYNYLNWAKGVNAFWPRLLKWKSSGVKFSMRNVLKREYNGFFAVFISFAFINVVKNYRNIGSFDFDFIIDKFWLYSLVISFIIFIILRTLKKTTKVLDEDGREYISE